MSRHDRWFIAMLVVLASLTVAVLVYDYWLYHLANPDKSTIDYILEGKR